MQIKVHVTLQELKNFYIAGFADFPKDAELVVDERGSTTCKVRGCWVNHPNGYVGDNEHVGIIFS